MLNLCIILHVFITLNGKYQKTEMDEVICHEQKRKQLHFWFFLALCN